MPIKAINTEMNHTGLVTQPEIGRSWNVPQKFVKVWVHAWYKLGANVLHTYVCEQSMNVCKRLHKACTCAHIQWTFKERLNTFAYQYTCSLKIYKAETDCNMSLKNIVVPKNHENVEIRGGSRNFWKEGGRAEPFHWCSGEIFAFFLHMGEGGCKSPAPSPPPLIRPWWSQTEELFSL